MNQPRLFLLVPTHKNSQKEWNPVASSTSLFELEKLAAKLNCVNRWKVVQTMLRVMREHQIAFDSLTEAQFAEAIRQALSCGDFIRHVVAGTDAQQVIYLPYAREQELESRITRLEAALQQHGIPDPDRIEA